MRALRRRVRHIITTVSMVVLFLCVPARTAEFIPSAADINDLAEEARSTAGKFMRESFEVRLGYEFSGKFLTSGDRENLHKLAKTAGDRLREIAQKQQNLSRRIEDYEGDDWETRYGSTGLWRKLQRDRYLTSLSSWEIDYYLALSTQPPKQNEILCEILSQIDSTAPTRNTAYAQLLKAMTHALLAQTEPAHRLIAREQFNELTYRSDMDEGTALRTAIEKIKLLGPSAPDELEKLAEAIAPSSRSDDIELVLSLASLQRRYNADALRETLRTHPQIEDFLGSCILSELSCQIERGQLAPGKMSLLEAELAARAAWNHTPRPYNAILQSLAGAQESQSPLILYVAAIACADSSPTQAVELLVKASRLQQAKENKKLNVEAVEVARQAAQLAYTLFAQARQHCPLVLDAFDNYALMAGDQIDEQLEYLYTAVLNNCAKRQKAEELLQKIAGRPAGKWHKRAKLDLIKLAVLQKRHQVPEQRSKLLGQLDVMIAETSAENDTHRQLRTEAIYVYCRLLLESQDGSSAQKVLDAVAEPDEIQDPNLALLKSIALQRLGRLNESARCLVGAVGTSRCDHVAEAMDLLSQVTDQIDRFGSTDLSFMNDCERLARFCYDCLEDKPKQKAGFFLLEISAYSAKEAQDRLSPHQKLLDHLAAEGLNDHVDFIRCRARLSARRGKFEEAARLWRQVAEIRTNDSATPGERSWKWWRAKYYELYCRSQCPQTDKESLLHTIEVLENSFTAMPPLWAEKIRSLKQIRETGESIANN